MDDIETLKKVIESKALLTKIDLLEIAINDLKHYGSLPIVINNLNQISESLIAHYNETFVQKKPEEPKKEE